jgi:hypothetical protein
MKKIERYFFSILSTPKNLEIKMSFATIITQSKQLSKMEQFSLAMELLKSFEPQIKIEKKVVPSISIEVAKALPSLPLLPASDAEPIKEKKPPSVWMNHMAHVRSFLPKEAQGKPCLQISSMLKAEDKMFADEADVLDAYARWQENPPAKAEKKPKAEKAASSASSVVSDEEPKEQKRRGPKKLVDMTEEERAVHDAKKAARKAEKAVKEAESTDEEEPKEQKRRGPKKLADMTEEERAAHEAKKTAKKAVKTEWPPFPPMPSLVPFEEEIVVE